MGCLVHLQLHQDMGPDVGKLELLGDDAKAGAFIQRAGRSSHAGPDPLGAVRCGVIEQGG